MRSRTSAGRSRNNKAVVMVLFWVNATVVVVPSTGSCTRTLPSFALAI